LLDEIVTIFQLQFWHLVDEVYALLREPLSVILEIADPEMIEFSTKKMRQQNYSQMT
jgi:hypothetical protein